MNKNYLSKKSWHTGSLKHIEKVWKAERQAEEEQKKLEELRRQLKEEREREALVQLQIEGGHKRQTTTRLDWMYMAPATGGSRSTEEFLLGKRVQEEPPKQEESSALGLFQAKQANPAQDAWRKLQDDPLLEIKRQEQLSIDQIRNNPVKMKKLRETLLRDLNGEAAKTGDAEKEKKHKHHKHKHHKHRRHHSRSKSRERSPSPHAADSRQERHKERERGRERETDHEKEHRKERSELSTETTTSRSATREDDRASRHRHEDDRHHRRRSRSPKRHKRTREERDRDHPHREQEEFDHKRRRVDSSSSPLPTPSDVAPSESTTSTEERKYGLVYPKGIPPAIKPAEPPVDTATQNTAQAVPRPRTYRPPRLSEEEREAMLRRMAADAEVRDSVRMSRLREAMERDEKEREKEALNAREKGAESDDEVGMSTAGEKRPDFIVGVAAAAGRLSVEQRLKRNAHYRQRDAGREESGIFKSQE